MIRMIQCQSAAQAKSYFKTGLEKSDYYINDQELKGEFYGRLVSRLGIDTSASKKVFDCLCENINPATGKSLTQRNIQNRTTGYDINFHCPKSISVLHVLSKDDHILKAFQQSVMETMQDMENDSLVRVRKNGRDENRPSGEWLWAQFIHQTARPVKTMLPDPHLHAHCFTFNVAWDKTEQQFKAGQFRNIKRDMPYYQVRFHKRLSDNLIKLGYRIRRTRKSFEVAGIPQSAIDLFSKRTDEIGRYVKKHGITDAKQKDHAGARTRSKKRTDLTMADLKQDWRKQIHQLGIKDNKADGKPIRYKTAKDVLPVTAQQSIAHALQHRFERASVMPDKRILETAYRYAMGTSRLPINDIDKSFESDGQILKATDKETTLCTTQKVLNEERCMVDLAAKGKGKFPAIYAHIPFINLNGEQKDAVQFLLINKDQVSALLGRAGTGKTTLMKEAVSLIEQNGKKVVIVAPTAQAARSVLKGEGFEQAETVAKLLSDKDLQASLQDAVLWVDEAGLLGVQDMTALLRLAVSHNTKVILGGDTRQHASVARGDALRVLITLAEIPKAEISTIYRQKDKAYREAVQAISGGNIQRCFELLDDMGAIHEIDPANPARQLTEDYITATKKGKSVLVISPTHAQGEFITGSIRQALKQAGKVGKQDVAIRRLINANLTEAEKEDIRSYDEGQVLQFNQNFKGIKRGSSWIVKTIQENALVLVDKENQPTLFAMNEKKHFDVFMQSQLSISKGDKIRITKNGFDIKGNRLNNGHELQVIGLDSKGSIRLLNTRSRAEYKLPNEFGHLAHAYCLTSHASQGKTVDEVLIYQPSATFPATDMKQFYVSLSRGRKAAKVYTDDKDALFNNVSNLNNRPSALELFTDNNFAPLCLNIPVSKPPINASLSVN